MGDLDEVGVVDERRDGHTAEVDVLQHRVRGSVRGRVGVRVGVRGRGTGRGGVTCSRM